MAMLGSRTNLLLSLPMLVAMTIRRRFSAKRAENEVVKARLNRGPFHRPHMRAAHMTPSMSTSQMSEDAAKPGRPQLRQGDLDAQMRRVDPDRLAVQPVHRERRGPRRRDRALRLRP